VTKGIPFRTAHQIVGTLVAKCEHGDLASLSQLQLSDFADAVKAHYPQAESKIGKDLFDALGAKNVVKRYRSAGAAGGKPFEEQLAAWKKRLGI
jgi:argininosuccinate lyase